MVNFSDKYFFSSSSHNSKLYKHKKLFGFSLPPGYTCPGARECLSYVDMNSNKIIDDPENKIRCYAATMEVIYPALRQTNRRNLNLLAKHLVEGINFTVEKFNSDIPNGTEIIRFHCHGGDFFNIDYFQVVKNVCELNKNILFYAYTKMLPFIATLDIPENLKLIYSFGGKYDDLLESLNGNYYFKDKKIITCKVVFSEQEANDLNLKIDHDDSFAMKADENFALLLHGVQPKGSVASKALSSLKKNGFSGYNRMAKKTLKQSKDENLSL